MLSIFSCAFWPSVCLLWINVYLDLLPIFLKVGFFFNIKLHEMFIYFVDESLVSCFVCKDRLQLSGLCLHFFMVSFSVQKLVSLIRSHLLIFFYYHYSRGWIKEDIAVINVKECPAYVLL